MYRPLLPVVVGLRENIPESPLLSERSPISGRDHRPGSVPIFRSSRSSVEVEWSHPCEAARPSTLGWVSSRTVQAPCIRNEHVSLTRLVKRNPSWTAGSVVSVQSERSAPAAFGVGPFFVRVANVVKFLPPPSLPVRTLPDQLRNTVRITALVPATSEGYGAGPNSAG